MGTLAIPLPVTPPICARLSLVCSAFADGIDTPAGHDAVLFSFKVYPWTKYNFSVIALCVPRPFPYEQHIGSVNAYLVTIGSYEIHKTRFHVPKSPM
jgi:hypothetical protein